jgi:hypothetical protein
MNQIQVRLMEQLKIESKSQAYFPKKGITMVF